MRRPLSLATLLLAFTWSAIPAAAQTLEDVLAKNLKAKGGAESLKSTNSVRMTGRLSAPSAPGEMAITIMAKRPNMVRREMAMAGQTMAFGFDGTNVWAQQGAGPAQPITGPQADQVKQTAEFDSVFLTYKEAGHTVELVGPETVDGRSLHHVKVTRKDGMVQHYYLDAETGLEARMVVDADQGGMKMKVETSLSDYRNVDGRMIPFKLKQTTNGTPSAEITFDKIEFNVPMEDALFKMPAGGF